MDHNKIRKLNNLTQTINIANMQTQITLNDLLSVKTPKILDALPSIKPTRFFKKAIEQTNNINIYINESPKNIRDEIVKEENGDIYIQISNGLLLTKKFNLPKIDKLLDDLEKLIKMGEYTVNVDNIVLWPNENGEPATINEGSELSVALIKGLILNKYEAYLMRRLAQNADKQDDLKGELVVAKLMQEGDEYD